MNLLIALTTSSIVGSVVFIALLLFRPITGRMFSKTWHYYCLLVPLVFLLGGTHVAISLAYLIPRPATVETSPVLALQGMTTDIPLEFIRPPMFDNSLSVHMRDSEADNTNLPITPPIASRLMMYLESITPFLLALWILGAILFIIISTMKYLQYRRLVLHKAKYFTDIGCKLPIIISVSAHTPMLIGVIKPVIVLPNMYFADAELDMVLAHEMMHYRRKDLFIKLLMLIANAIHWFNPAVYALNRQLNIMCELSCDEKIVSEMDMQNRKFYGETILQVLKHSTTQGSLVGNVAFATNMYDSKKDFKRRLISMMNTKKMRKSILVLALATGLLVVGGGFVISYLVDSVVPVYAADDELYTSLETIAELPIVTIDQGYIVADEDVEAPVFAPIPIYYNDEVVGFEAHPDAETIIVEDIPLIFSDSVELLESIYEEMGNIMWPTYLPEGFALSGIGVLNPRDFSPHPGHFSDNCYRHLNILNVSFSDGENVIRLWITYFQSYSYRPSRNPSSLDRSPFSLDLYPFMEHESLIDINGFQAILSLPAYPYWLNYTVTLFDTDNGLLDYFANPHIAEIPYGGTSYQFTTVYDTNISEEDLIRMAESLTNILNLMQ